MTRSKSKSSKVVLDFIHPLPWGEPGVRGNPIFAFRVDGDTLKAFERAHGGRAGAIEAVRAFMGAGECEGES